MMMTSKGEEFATPLNQSKCFLKRDQKKFVVDTSILGLRINEAHKE